MTLPSFPDLRNRIDELSSKFLDVQIINEMSAEFSVDIESIAAFRLLTHAEIEVFLESIAKEKLLSLRSAISKGANLSDFPWIYSIGMSLGKTIPFECPVDAIKLKKSLLDLVTQAEQEITDNNGIKSHSLMRVCVFSGIHVDEIDAALALQLNSFGKERGEVAHSSTKRVRTINSPSVEKANVSSIIDGIENFFRRIGCYT